MSRVLITGGSKGIGQLIGQQFVNAGWEVVVAANDFNGFILSGNPSVREVWADLYDLASIPSLVEQVGTVDVLINNAGILPYLPFDAYPEEKKQAVLRINLEAPIALMQLMGPRMIAQGGGKILNVASIAGQVGHPDVWYGATKAGLINATKSFAKIFGPHNIQVNAVAPGSVEGSEMAKLIEPDREQRLRSATVNGEFVTGEDIATTIFWLATTAPKHLTGTCIDINNGAR